MKTYLILVLFISSFISCSQKKTVKKKVRVQAQIRMAAMAGYGGGGILVGTNGPDSFTKYLDSNTLSIELPNGLWDFMVIGWTGGDGSFSGNMLCDIKQAINLEGDEVSLPFVLASSKCNSPVLGPHTLGYEGNGQPFPLTFNSCSNWLQMVADVDANLINPFTMTSVPFCDDSEGKEISFKLRMFQSPLSANPWATKNNPIESSCQGDRTIGAGPMFTSNLRWPMISPGFARVPIEIIAYDGANCSGSARVYQFTQGSGDFAIGNEAIFSPASDKIGITLHSNLCEGAFLTNTPFANHTSTTFVNDKEYLICSAAQLQELADKWVDWNGANTGLHFNTGVSIRLGANIDLGSGTFTTPIGNISYPFSAEFNGGEHILSNWSYSGTHAEAGLFGVIGDAEIENLTLHNFNMAPSSGTVNLGILFGSTEDAASIRTEISHIKITRDNGAKSVDCDFCARIGGLGGSVFSSSANRDFEIRSVDLENIFVDGGEIDPDGFTNGLETASDDIGGVFGAFYNNGSSHFRANDIHFTGTVEGHSHVAGFASLFEEAELDECSITANGAHYIQGHEYVGGIVAEVGAFGGVNNRVGKCELDVVLKVAGLDTDGGPTSTRRYIGGAFGWAKAGDFSDLLVDLEIQSAVNDDTHYIGGVAGFSGPSSACGTSLTYYNVKADSVIPINGEFVGGAFGEYKCGEAKNFMILTDISTKSTVDGDNEYRGLFAGQFMDSSSMLDYAILNGNVTGSGHVGGIAGYNQGWINNVFIEDNSTVTCNRSNLTGIAGGVVGKTATSSNIANIISHADVYYTQSGAYNDGGKYVGFSGIDNTTANDNIVLLGEIDDGSPTPGGDSFVCGTGGATCTNSAPDLFEGMQPIANPPFNADPNWADDGSSNATLSFTKAWFNFNYDSVNGVNDPTGDVLAGNYFEPLHIYDCDDWNNIADNEILMYKSFILQEDVDFDACGSFIPIGGDETVTNAHRFLGNIIANRKQIKNVNFNFSQAINNAWGLVRYLGDYNVNLRPRIGDWREPLVVDGINFNGGSYAIDAPMGVMVGMMEAGDVSVHVNNSNLTAGGSCGGCFQGIGGVVGQILEGNLDGSSFRNGNITATSGTYDNIGGLIGKIESSSSMREARVSIYESMSNAIIAGNANIGGMIGRIDTQMNHAHVDIRDSYYFNNNPDPFTGSAQIGTFIGYMTQISNSWDISLKMENSYGYANFSTGTIMAIGDAFNNDGSPENISIYLDSDIYYSNEGGTAVQTYTHADDTLSTGSFNNYGNLASLYTDISANLDEERFTFVPGEQRAKLRFEVEGYYNDHD